MIESLAASTALAGVAISVWVAVAAARGTYRWRRALLALAALEIALIVDAIADVIALARGHHPKEPGVHLAYLIVSLLIAPVVGVQIAGDNTSSRWSAGLAAVGALVIAVVVIRAQTTWRAV